MRDVEIINCCICMDVDSFVRECIVFYDMGKSMKKFSLRLNGSCNY